MRLPSTDSINKFVGVQTVKRVLKDGTTAVYVYERKPKPWTHKVKIEPPDPPPVPLQTDPAPGTRTMRDLLRAYEGSLEFSTLAPSTRDSYVRRMRWLKPYLEWPVEKFTRQTIIVIRDKLFHDIAAPTALAFVTVVYAIFRFADDAGGWVAQSPAYRLTSSGGKGKRNLLQGGSHTPWSEPEFELALRHLAEPLRRAIILLRYSGQRLGDVCKMTWGDFNVADETILLVQEKTKEKLLLPVHPVLLAELKVWQREMRTPVRWDDRAGKVVQLRPQPVRSSDTILLSSKAVAWNTDSLGEALERNLYAVPGFPRKDSTRRGKRADGTYSTGREREIAGRSAHGLRYLAAISLAEADCTLKEIMSVTGHRTVNMAMKYIKETEQARFARSAFAKLVSHEQRRGVR